MASGEGPEGRDQKKGGRDPEGEYETGRDVSSGQRAQSYQRHWMEKEDGSGKKSDEEGVSRIHIQQVPDTFKVNHANV